MSDHKLEHEIIPDEVNESLVKLNNNRAPGYDKITAEMTVLRNSIKKLQLN